MMFAVLSGDPAKGEYPQMRKVPAGTYNGKFDFKAAAK